MAITLTKPSSSSIDQTSLDAQIRSQIHRDVPRAGIEGNPDQASSGHGHLVAQLERHDVDVDGARGAIGEELLGEGVHVFSQAKARNLWVAGIMCPSDLGHRSGVDVPGLQDVPLGKRLTREGVCSMT